MNINRKRGEVMDGWGWADFRNMRKHENWQAQPASYLCKGSHLFDSRKWGTRGHEAQHNHRHYLCTLYQFLGFLFIGKHRNWANNCLALC